MAKKKTTKSNKPGKGTAKPAKKASKPVRSAPRKSAAPKKATAKRDPLAPVAIKAWIDAARLSNVPDSKLESAHLAIEAMERWPGGRHYPD